MRLSKRFAIGVFAIVMSLSMMTGCGGSTNEKPSSSGNNSSSSSSSASSENNSSSNGSNSNSTASGENASSSSAPSQSESKKDEANSTSKTEDTAKPAKWEDTWTYKYFKKFDDFPDGMLLDFDITGDNLSISEYYVFDRASNRGYVRFLDKTEGYTIEEIVLYSKPVPNVGYEGYTIYEMEEGKKAAAKTTLNISEVIKIDPSKSAFDSMTVDDNYKLKLDDSVYHAEKVLMDYDGKTFGGQTGAHGSGKAVFAYCYDKKSGELKYIVTPKEILKINQISKNFNKNLVKYEQYELLEIPSAMNP